MLGNALLVFAMLTMLHAAFSTYEHLSLLKAAGRPEESIPTDIIIETFVSVVLGIVAATLRTPELKQVTWRSEMKMRPLEEMDPRMSFATFAQRAGILTGSHSKAGSK